MEPHYPQKVAGLPTALRFGEFELDLRAETLRRGGEKINIKYRMLQVLRLLADRQGTVISKKDFFDEVWEGSFVEDNNLTVTITTLRKILGDDAKRARFIETVPRKGYRFIAPVERVGEPEEQPAAADTVQAITTRSVRRRLATGALFALMVVGLTVIGFASMGLWRSRSPSPPDRTAATKADSIAILPFGFAAAESEYLADGLTDGVIGRLSRLPRLRVIDRNSAFKYKGKAIDKAKAGRDLNVRTVVTGQVEQQGDMLLVSVEMFDLNSGSRIWQREFRPRAADPIAVQDEISQAIAGSLLSGSGGQELGPPTKHPTYDPEAYDLYLKGRYYWNKRANADFIRSIEMFRAAIDRDPTFAQAYIGLANSYTLASLSGTGISNDEKIALSRGAVQRALEIDDTIGEAHAATAINKCYYDWDFAGAESDYRRAIELSPNDATAHHWYAEFLSMQGRFDESFAEYDKALSLDPLSLPIRTDMAFAHYYARDYDKAIELLNIARQIDPDYHRTYTFLMFTYREKGLYADAANAYERDILAQYTPNERTGEYFINIARHIAAIKSEGSNLTAERFWRAELEFQDDPAPIYKAIAHAKLGEPDKAFEYLEQAFKERSSGLVWLKVSPEFDGIRQDPRFPELLHRVGLQ